MRISVDYNSDLNSFVLDYDPEASRAFRSAARAARQFCNDDESLDLLAQATHQTVDQFIRGYHMLRTLGHGSSALTEVNLQDLRFGLSLSCFVLLYRLDRKEPYETVLQTIMLLANSVPFPLPRTNLPPIEEVLDIKAISSDVFAAYHRVADSKGQTSTVLMPLTKIDGLGTALDSIEFDHAGIERLRECSDTLAAPLRFVQDALRKLASRDGDKTLSNEPDF